MNSKELLHAATAGPTAKMSENSLPAARNRRHLSHEAPAIRVPTSVLNILAVIVALGIWWALGTLGIGGLPGPPQVFHRFAVLAGNGVLGRDVWASTFRVLVGFAIGTTLAILVGLLMGWYRTLQALLDPIIHFYRMIPPLATIPLAVVLFGIGQTPKIIVISLAAFLTTVIAVIEGVKNVDKTLINAARVLGLSSAGVFRRVIIPASLPYIFVGMRVGLGACWATLVAAELIAAHSGLGYLMSQAQIFYDLPAIFVGLICIGLLGLIMDSCLRFASRRLTSWQETR